MKIRTFTVTFLLFLTVFFTSLTLISALFFRMQVETAMERGGNEHYLISSSMGKELKSLMERGAKKEEVIQYLFTYYSEHYARQKGYLEIFQGNEMLCSSFPFPWKGKLYSDNGENDRTALLKRLDGKEYIIVTGYFPHTKQEYKIQYISDITSMIGMWEKLRNTLLVIGTGFSALAGVLLLLLLNLTFRPFSQVVAASGEIAGGNYEKRIPVPGNRELAVMADSFNDMAQKVQEAVTKLSRDARQKQQFIDNFSHEIRTPLTSVCGFAEYMQKSVLSEEERITMAGYIIEDSRYILNIADRLLTLATLTNGSCEKKKCLIQELFDGAKKLLHKRLEEKKIRLLWEDDCGCLYGDEDLLQSLLVNLTNNAADACSCGSTVRWHAYREGDKAILSVSDQGKGIPADQLDKIREPFYRVDPSRNRESGNAGLGLAICRQIAECHGAEMIFESKVQVGTTVKVIFTLP